MKFGSVCSGIEAASCAWEPLGWEAQWLSEIESFPSAVLKHRYPNVPNFGDMTKFKEWDQNANINVLVGGTPCQSFSVAGLRKGLDDPRGNLMLTYLAIAAKYRPKWLVWENVPGVLSSNGGNDFACLLRGMGELGYGFAYRILDAQYFGVAQRRRRVFVVGCFGDWRSAAAVLFERYSLCGNPAPSREKREEVAKCLTTGISQRYDPETETMIPTYGIPGNWIGRKPENGGNQTQPMNDISPCLTKTDRHGVATYSTPAIGNIREDDLASTMTKNTGSGGETQNPAYVLQSIACEVADTLTSTEVTNQVASVYAASMAVRRLTPTECERLQGFPDGYTNIPWRKQPESPDGPRYKALGNSMAVPVMAWIGQRIQMVEDLG